MLAHYASLCLESWLGHVLFSSPVTDLWCIRLSPCSVYEQRRNCLVSSVKVKFLKNFRVGRYEIFLFLFSKAIKIAGSAQKNRVGRVSGNVGRPFLGLRTIFTQAGSFDLETNSGLPS